MNERKRNKWHLCVLFYSLDVLAGLVLFLPCRSTLCSVLSLRASGWYVHVTPVALPIFAYICLHFGPLCLSFDGLFCTRLSLSAVFATCAPAFSHMCHISIFSASLPFFPLQSEHRRLLSLLVCYSAKPLLLLFSSHSSLPRHSVRFDSTRLKALFLFIVFHRTLVI